MKVMYFVYSLDCFWIERVLPIFYNFFGMSFMSGNVAEQVVEITKAEIDSNYIEEASYIEDFCEKEGAALFAAVQEKDDYSILKIEEEFNIGSDVDVVGYLLCRSYSYDKYDDYLYTDIEDVLRQTDYISTEDFPIYLFQSLAVRDGFQGNGIGGSLVMEAIEDEDSHLPFFAGAWSRSDDKRNVSIMETHGVHIATVENYYPDDWDCPVCESSCCCNSVFYALK